jgi:hypothetical protein
MKPSTIAYMNLVLSGFVVLAYDPIGQEMPQYGTADNDGSVGLIHL